MPGFTVYHLVASKEDEGIRMKVLPSWDSENLNCFRQNWKILWTHYDKCFLYEIFDRIIKGAYIESAEDDLVFLPMREVLRRRDELDKMIDILKALEDIFLFIGEICNITPRYTRWKDQ